MKSANASGAISSRRYTASSRYCLIQWPWMTGERECLTGQPTTHAARAPSPIVSVVADSRPAIDGDRGALDVARLLRAEEQRQRRNILRLAEPAQPVLDGRLLLQLVDRLAGRLRAHFEELIEALGLGRAGMNDVDVDAVLLALLRQRLGKIAHRSVDRSADREIGAWRARRAAADVDDKAVRRLQHRPERAAHPHATEQLERIAVHPGF